MARDQGTEFAILHTHFSGMATSRLGDNDATRIAELLGNREAGCFYGQDRSDQGRDKRGSVGKMV
jgi:hypothetical protein